MVSLKQFVLKYLWGMNSNNIVSESLNFQMYSAALHNSHSLSLFARPCSRRTSCHGASLTTYQLWHYILRSLPHWICSGTNPKEWFWQFIVNVVFWVSLLPLSSGMPAAYDLSTVIGSGPSVSHNNLIPLGMNHIWKASFYCYWSASLVLKTLTVQFIKPHLTLITPLCCFGSSLSNIKGLLVWKHLKVLSFSWAFGFSDISDIYIRIQLLVCFGAYADFCKAADVALSQKRHAFMALVKWFVTPDATWF